MEQLMKKSSDSRQAWSGDFLYTIKLPGMFETGGYSERIRINRESTLCCISSVPAAGICSPCRRDYVDLGRAEQLKKEKMEKAVAIQAGRLDKTPGMSEMNISENNND